MQRWLRQVVSRHGLGLAEQGVQARRSGLALLDGPSALRGGTARLTKWVDETPRLIIWGINIGFAGITTVRLREAIRGRRNTFYALSRRAAIIDAALVGCLLTIAAIPALLGSGLLDNVVNKIKSAIPFLDQTVSGIVTWVLTFAIPSAISGVIGNFVYDILKKTVQRKDANKPSRANAEIQKQKRA